MIERDRITAQMHESLSGKTYLALCVDGEPLAGLVEASAHFSVDGFTLYVATFELSDDQVKTKATR